MNAAHVDALKRIYGGPISERELKILHDVQAFIDFAIRNGFSFRSIMGVLAHDANGVIAQDEMFEKGIFRPMVEGYTEINADAAEEADAMGQDPSLQMEQQSD
jgi:hypothetical protein